MRLKIVIVGVGGQGVLSAAKIIGGAVLEAVLMKFNVPE